MSYKQLENGKNGEKLLCKIFRENGYWCHLFERNSSGGQPVDIVALRGNDNWLVDSKFIEKQHCSFSLNYVQPNQDTTLRYAREWCKLKNLGFVIFFERDITNPRFLSFDTYLSMLENNEKSKNMNDLPNFKDLLLAK